MQIYIAVLKVEYFMLYKENGFAHANIKRFLNAQKQLF